MFFRRPGACISDPPFEAAKKIAEKSNFLKNQTHNGERGLKYIVPGVFFWGLCRSLYGERGLKFHVPPGVQNHQPVVPRKGTEAGKQSIKFTEGIPCSKIYHPNPPCLHCSGKLCLRFGKSCVPRLTKNRKWNNYGIPAVRVGLTSISIREAAKRFVAYMQKVIVSVS